MSLKRIIILWAITIQLNLNSPGVVVHEFAHQSYLDKLPKIEISPKQYKQAALFDYYNNGNLNYDFMDYSAHPDEIGARLWQKRYLLDRKDYDEGRDVLEDNPIDAILYNKNNYTKYFK